MKKENNLGVYIKDSHMWGFLFLDFLRKQKIPFKIITSPQEDELKDIKLIVIPGGFASEKSKKLGFTGLKRIKDFVANGGIYLGICGGAGLCLSHGENTLGICNLKRKKIQFRLPNFSGHIKVSLSPHIEELLGSQKIERELALPVWWPSQFEWNENKNIKELARYVSPMDDLWIADIPYYVLKKMHVEGVEKIYGINLDFSYIISEPCIVYGDYGRGKYLLSYPHLETPGSSDANRLLICILNHFLEKEFDYNNITPINLLSPNINWDDKHLILIYNELHHIIKKAQENFLVCWRDVWLLGWRRGVIGLSLNSLLYMISFLLEISPSVNLKNKWNKIKQKCYSLFLDFKREFESYIITQREFYLKHPHRAPDRFGQDPIHKQIIKLTGQFPGDGGIFKKISNELEELISVYFCE